MVFKAALQAPLFIARAKPVRKKMFKRGLAILSVLVLLSIISQLSSVRADQAFQRFLPLLIDLDGWQGNKPDGMSMEMSDASMTTASRAYERGSAQVRASVIVGQAAAGALAPLQTGMNVQTPEGHVISSTMRGMQVLKSYTTQQKSGVLIVALGQDAVFNFEYNGTTEQEALALAETFDWKAIQAATQKK